MQTNGAPSAANRLDRPYGDDTDALVRAFLIADVRGYTSFTQTRGDEPAAQLAATFAALARETVAAIGGEVVELRGDEALCVFPSARQALRAAVAMQVRFRDRIDDEPAFPLGVGIGVAAGEAVRVEGGYRGGALNLAARLCSLARGGQILASETVTSLAGALEGVRFVERRRAKVKGFETPVRVIEVIPELELPSVPQPHRRAARRRRPIALLAAAAALITVAVVAVALTRNGNDGSASTVATVIPDSLAVVDPSTDKTVDEVHIPGRPSLVASGPRSVWVASDATRTISSVAPDRLTVTHVVAANATPTALAVEGNAVWVLDGSRRVLLKIDPAYDEPTQRIALPPAPPLPATNQRLSSLSVAFGAGALWVTDGSSKLFRVDPANGAKTTLHVHQPLDDVAVEGDAVWAVSGPAATLFKIDGRGRRVESRIRIVNRLGTTAPYPVAVAAGEGAVWVVNANTQTVSKIDPQFDNVAATIPLGIGRNPSDIATGAGAVWVANGGNGTLARIDPGTNAVTSIPLGNNPTHLTVADKHVWVSVQPGFRAFPNVAAESAGPSEQALPVSSCSPVEYQGKGRPRFLIASDLPFQGQSSLAETLQMSDAVRFVLARHHFRAGPYTVGYQSCDDSTASTGSYDTGRCRANAKAFAATKSVIALVAGYNSGCVKAQLPVLARAPGGPLVLVGSASTYVGLTHAGAGAGAGEPEKYQPGGRRSFVRVVVADDVQGAADAMIAKRLGVKRLYVLHDRDVYGIGIATSVRHAATKLGIRVVGFDGWNPRAHTYVAFARHIARARPDGVFLGGSVDISNGPAVVKGLRAVLGSRVQIVLPDGFSPLGAFADLAGPAAEGLTETLPAPAPQRLRGQGRQFVLDFGKALGRPVEFYSSTAAQATEILLDAIARSDGTRASVTRAVFKTKVRGGILGSFSFDANGDTTAGSVTIYRIVDGKPKLVGLITPSPMLVR